MKECKIIHIRDESPRALTDGNRHYAADFPWAEKMLEEHLNAGYQIAQMIPDYAPVDGTSFCKDGFTVLLIRECRQYDVFVEQEDWERLNTPASYEFPDDEDGDVEDIHDIVGEMVGQMQIGSDDSLDRFMDEEGNLPFH